MEQGEMTDQIVEQGQRGAWARRKLLWLGGIGALVGLTRGSTPAEATNGEPLIVGDTNTSTLQTRLVGNVNDASVLYVEQQDNDNADVAILSVGGAGRGAIFGIGGEAASGPGGTGVAGQGGKSPVGESVGVIGSGGGPTDSNRGDGVRGATASATNAGVFGFNFGSGPAVRGYSAVATGGTPSPTGNGTGVEGKSGGGKAIHGAASASGGLGVLAEHTGSGLGLAVKGRAGFSTCGSGTIAASKDSADVSNPAVGSNSHISVTLTSNPGTPAAGGPGPRAVPAPAQVLWVERTPGTGFVVHMTDTVLSQTSFTYLIVEPSP
jgi:hypothetical protein